MTPEQKIAYYRTQLLEISVLVRVMAGYECQIERLINNRSLPLFEKGLREFIENKNIPKKKKK